jgi:hypothetical protein
MRMKAMFANEDEQLWPGDFVTKKARPLSCALAIFVARPCDV